MPTEQLPGIERALRPDEREHLSEPSPVVESLATKTASDHAQRGGFLRLMGNLDEALDELQIALKIDRNDAYALATKGRIQSARGQRNDAVELLQKAVSLDPGLDWALTELIDLLRELERENDAVAILERLLSTDQKDVPTQGIYGRLRRQMGQLKPAATALERAIELRSDLAWLHAQFGEVLRLQGQFPKALAAFSEAESLAEKKSLSSDVITWILTRQGWILTETRRYAEAVKALTRAFDFSPQNAVAGRLKAQALWGNGQHEECFRFLKDVIAASAKPTWAYIELASYAQDMGLYKEALEVFDDCLAEDLDPVEFLIRKGDLLHRVGDFEESAKALKKAHELDRTNWRALGQRASALKYLGRDHHEEALAAIGTALELAGSEATLLSARGDILRAQGDAEAAEQDYRRAIDELDVRIKERPHSIDAPTMWLMGWCWLWLGDDDLAFRLLAHAKSLKPDLYIVRFFLALALLIRGQVLQARREYEAALKTIEGKPPLLRRGILRSSLYALRVAREQQQISPENTAERVALDQQQTSPEATAARIVRDLEKELDRATAEIDSNIPKHSAPFLESRSKKPGILVEGDDLGAEPDSAPYINLLVRPTADPTVPMIRLDNEFKILDWNIAASLAFDGTLEDRRGEWVGNWILQHFDNPLTVAEHGQTAFGNPNRQPLIDVEQQHFTNRDYGYGGLDMTKRAYRIPDDDSSCLGWLIIFEVRFSDPEHFLQFRKDLIRELNQDNVWSEHALSYDKVLSKSSVYDELLRTLIGEIGPLQRIPDGARVLDLGAGTGGLTLKLAKTSKQLYIVAVDKNSAMLDALLDKCRRYLHAPRENHGVVAIRQNVTKLSGALGPDKEKFDFAFLVNVLNTLSAPEEALRGVFDLLKPGGEIRITGPRHDSKVAVLFDAFKKDLEQQGLFEQLRPYYEHLRELNERQLSPTFQWTVADIERMLVDVGFSKIIERGEKVGVYAGQSMLIAARR